MKCCAGLGLLGAGFLGNSRLIDTARPLRTNPAAFTRFSGVIRLTAPTWSSAPQRPQLRRSFRKDSTAAFVGSGRSGMPRRQELPVVGLPPRFEVPFRRDDLQRRLSEPIGALGQPRLFAAAQ